MEYPIINLILNDSIATISNTAVDFDFLELPYGAKGYRNNGSSKSPEENLNLYWNFIDGILQELNLDNSSYITIKSIEYANNFYGFL